MTPLASDPQHQSGTIPSGDTTLAYRLFGTNGKTPLLILHGTNYYDSVDWIEVAAALATDREVATFDHRGFGASSWSSSKNYSLDAMFGDIRAVMAHFGWERPIVMGHSMSGRLSIFFAANFPDDLSKLIIVDSGLDRGGPAGYAISLNNEPVMFDTVDDAMARFAKLANPPRIAHDRARAMRALTKTDDGRYMLRRDPDYTNRQDQTPGAPKPTYRDLDIWQELARITCPRMIIRGSRSTRFPPEILNRLETDFPDIPIATVDSDHDVAYGARDELLLHVQRFIGEDG